MFVSVDLFTDFAVRTRCSSPVIFAETFPEDGETHGMWYANCEGYQLPSLAMPSNAMGENSTEELQMGSIGWEMNIETKKQPFIVSWCRGLTLRRLRR